MKQIDQNINSQHNLKKINGTAILVLESGKIFKGFGLGYEGSATGEVCFNTSVTGYQEIISDPSPLIKLLILLSLMLEMLGQIMKIMSLIKSGRKEL